MVCLLKLSIWIRPRVGSQLTARVVGTEYQVDRVGIQISLAR